MYLIRLQLDYVAVIGYIVTVSVGTRKGIRVTEKCTFVTALSTVL